jgi:catechol 2,3-dioxygenase-like lactoylglutathione lyase family enzyme
MIIAVNHVALAADDAARAAADYELVFGRKAKRLTSDDGRSAYRFQLDNIAFEIGEAPGGAAGLQGIAFEVDDMAATTRKLSRRGIGVEATQSERWTDGSGTLARDIARLGVATTCGVAMSLVETTQSLRELTATAPASAVTAIDHLVVRSRNPERAIALYGGRLGLDFALDRTNPDWGARLLFFRCGGVRVEIGHALGKGVSDDPDVLSGLAWKVSDAAEAQQRLQASGVQTSDAKKGRRPGSQVLTVRSNTCNVPTLFLSETPRDDAAA